MSQHTRAIQRLPGCERSTLLVSITLLNKVMRRNRAQGKTLKAYLHYLLSDPAIEHKLSFLRSKKWKKVYQDSGQGLVRMNFYPNEVDWARLSVLSNATGYSRCFLFVYLMKLDLQQNGLQNSVTLPTHLPERWIRQIFCSIMLDERENLLVRVLRT